MFDKLKCIFKTVLFVSVFFSSVGNADDLDDLDGLDDDEPCFQLKVRFGLDLSFETDGSFLLSGDVYGGPLRGARLEISTQPTDLRPGIAGLVPESTMAVLAKGAYTLKNGDQLFVEVLNVSDNDKNVAAGIQTITGGTGKFTGVTGVLTGTGVLSGLSRRSVVRGNLCFN